MKTVKEPITKGVAKVPVIMQMEFLECGAASLAMILAYYGKWIPLEQVREDCGVSRDGSNALNVLKAARNYGMEANGYRYEPEELREDGIFPCIAHWEFNHFIVVKGFKGNKVYINDPARGNVVMSEEEFDEGFTGICLVMKPQEDFEPSGKRASIMSFAKERMKGTGLAVCFVVLTTMIISALDIVNAGFTRFYMDQLLTRRDLQYLEPFIIAFGIYIIVRLTASWIKSVYSLRIGGKLAAYGSTSFMWSVMNKPMSFFSQRMAGDLQQRKMSNETIAEGVIETLAPLALNLFMTLFYLVVMIRYSVVLTVIGLAGIFINILVSRIVSARRVNITRVLMRDDGKLAAATVSGIEMIETIKASGAENGFFQKWAGYQASVNTQNVKYEELNAYMGQITALVATLSNNLVLIMGVWLIMRGQFTEGMVVAFQGFLTSFMAPAQTLVSAGATLQEMRTDMERISDVMNYKAPQVFKPDDEESDAEYNKLTGQLELKNVTFGYSKLAKPLIENFSMTMKPGSRVAFVGSSGCGKSTLSKLISGLYQPWSGEVLFDGKPLREIEKSVMSSSVAVVDQDIILFEDTIENNIKMWDKSIEDFEMIMAARDSQLHNDIMLRDGGYNYRITEGGKDFSGGQRQRMEIARVLAQDPTLIILDEATSALDSKTEYEVVKSIKDRGITCVVIAHRLSTIRDCDEIIVMDKGKVVERGTHDELMAMDGMYKELVTSE